MPEYEVSSTSVDWLYQLARENERKEREAELLMEDMRQATEEYCSESMYNIIYIALRSTPSAVTNIINLHFYTKSRLRIVHLYTNFSLW